MAADQCLIRPYEPADCDGFLDLYETVWGHARDGDWFDWRFRENPYRDGVQMIVADHGGEIVGAEPLLPFRLRAGTSTVDAYQPVDWLVHPDHRRQGVFTRMTERLLDRYADDADFVFNFPNDALLPGLEKFDWRLVGDLPTSYRVQNPRPLVYDTVGETTATAVSPLLTAATTVTRQGLSLLDRFSRPPDAVTVERYSSVPTDLLESVYTSAPPDRIHVPRDEAFLRWRFDNPNWETRSYVASRDGDPVASVVTATERVDDCTTTMLLDCQPATGYATRPDAVEALLVRILRDNRDVDVLKTLGWLATRIRRRYGFLNDSAVSLSRFSTISQAAVRPLRDGGGLDAPDPWQINGLDVTDPDNWRLTLADLDVE